MNSMGVMQGSKETAKGKAMEAKHNADKGASHPQAGFRKTKSMRSDY